MLDADLFSDCVATAGEALQKIEEESYGLIIADLGLPDGVERVVQCIARMDRARRPIVLVLAANPEAARSLDVDIVQIVLRRPVDLRQLVDLVRNCLRVSTTPGERTNGNGDDDGDGDGGHRQGVTS